MKLRRRILPILVGVVLVGIAVFFISRFGPKTMRVELSGTTGLKIAGSYEANGSTYEFSGVVPTNFAVEAKHFSYTIMKLDSDGELEGKLFVENKAVGMSRTPGPYSGVRGEYSFDGSLFHRRADSLFTTVLREE